MHGVQAVVTGRYFTHPVGVIYEDRPVLAHDKVRYYGEPIAVVVANSEYEAKRAADAVEIQYEELPVVNSPSEVTLEASFSLPQSDHVAMELRNVRVEIKADGRVSVHTSSQAPFIVRKLFSRYFGVDEGLVVVNTPYVGGAFGKHHQLPLMHYQVL